MLDPGHGPHAIKMTPSTKPDNVLQRRQGRTVHKNVHNKFGEVLTCGFFWSYASGKTDIHYILITILRTLPGVEVKRAGRVVCVGRKMK